jgi:hypothetical protein
MGIQINGQTDTISASDGGLAVSGYELTGASNINVTGIITATTLEANGGNVRMVDTNGRIYLQNGNTSNGAKIGVRGTSDATDGYLAFETNSIEFARFDSSGFFGIGSTNPSHELHIAGSGDTRALITSGGSGDAVMMFENASGNTWAHGLDLSSTNYVIAYNASGDPSLTTNGFVNIDTSGRLLIGTSSTFDQGATLQVNSSTGYSANLYVFGADNSQVNIGSARGTVASPSTLNSTDTIGGVYFRGYDGTSFKTGAQILAQIDDTTPSNDLPTRLVFYTTADGASSPTERMRITSKGYLKASNYGSYNDVGASYHENRSNLDDWTHLISNAHGSNPFGLLITHITVKNSTGNWFLYAQELSTLRFQVRSNGGIAN